MSAIPLDTNALIWFASGELLLPAALDRIAVAQKTDGIYVSPISAWEAALAVRKHSNRPNLGGLSASAWFKEVLALPGIKLSSPNRRIALEAADVPAIYGSGDPGDCFLIATARIRRVPIVTRDAAMIALSEFDAKYLQTIPC